MKSNSNTVQATVIDYLERHHRCPAPAGKEHEVVRDYLDALCRAYAPPELEAGMAKLRGQWRYQRWPTIAELHDFMAEAVRELRGGPTGRGTSLAGLSKDQAERRWAAHVMRSEIGRRACDNGCARELWVWATKHVGTEPTEEVLAACYSAQQRHEAIRTEIAEHGTMNDEALEPIDIQAARTFAAGMAKRERELRTEFGA